jgi:hypothetical protein
LSGIPDNVRNFRQTSNPPDLMIAFQRRIGPDPHANGAKTQSANGCPDIWELSDGDFAVIGPDITELASLLPATAGCGPDERIVRLPRRIFVGARSEIPRN